MAGEMIDKIREAEKKAEETAKEVQREKTSVVENAYAGIKALEEKEIQSAKKKAAQMIEGAVKEGEEEAVSIRKSCEERRKEIRESAQKNMGKAVSFITEEIKKSMR